MIARVCIALLLPVAAGASQSWDEPALGSAIDALDRQRYACTVAAAESRCRLEQAHALNLNGVAARARVLIYRQGRLERSCTTVDERHFDDLLKTLEASFGPGEQSTELLRAGMGGVFPNRLVLWRLEGKVVLLEQYFERVTQSAVSIMEPGSFAELMARRARSRVRGVRDL